MEYRSNCPECVNRKGSEDRGKHLYWNSDKETWFCFRCGYGGRGSNPAHDTPVAHKKFPGIKLSPKPDKLIDLLNAKDGGLRTTAACLYLKDHHIDPYHAAYRFNLLIDGQDLVFPVYRGSELIFFQKRNLFNKQFWNPDVESKPLFWVDRDESDATDLHCVVVESYVNAMRLEKYCRSVAIFGKFVSDEGAEEIKAKASYVHVLLDAGETEHALKIARKLRGIGIEEVFVKSIRGNRGLDVCDLDDEQVRRMFL